MRIYFGDLVHSWEKVSVWTIPLNVGFVAAYTRKFFPDAEIVIFKDPNELLVVCRNQRPDIVALSYYAWNENLDLVVTDAVKAFDSTILTVGGGPNFTVQNSNERDAKPFYAKHRSLDAFVVDQGEKGFVELVGRWLEVNGDANRLRGEMIPGVMTNDLAAHDRVLVGSLVGTVEDLDDIPSPYLTGLLDRFLADRFVPLLETNRSCPYQCTYCTLAVSSGSKLKTFSLERVFAEIDYIASRTTADYLITTDANFGILERDEEIARRIYATHIEHNYPGYLCVVWNKTRPDRVMKTARAFNGLAKVGASMQSMHPEVLAAIKRKNLPLEAAREMGRQLEADGNGFFSELIAPLPEQTFTSHIDDNKVLMDCGAEIYNYNLRLLPGTEMFTEISRDKYLRKAGWRLQVNAFGIYEGRPAFEGEELVLATPTMSEQEVYALRLIHFLLQFMWGKQFFKDYLQLFRAFGKHPMDIILAVAAGMQADGGRAEPRAIGLVFRRFEEDHALEKFATYEEMCAFWEKPENMERLRSGDLGKMNVYYGFELLRHASDLLSFLQETAKAQLGDRWDEARPLFEELDRFTRQTFVDLDRLPDIPHSKTDSFGWDIIGWRKIGYPPALPAATSGRQHKVEFFLSDKAAERLTKSFHFFEHANRVVTLRTMFDTNPTYFLFGAREAAAESTAAQ